MSLALLQEGFSFDAESLIQALVVIVFLLLPALRAIGKAREEGRARPPRRGPSEPTPVDRARERAKELEERGREAWKELVRGPRAEGGPAAPSAEPREGWREPPRRPAPAARPAPARAPEPAPLVRPAVHAEEALERAPPRPVSLEGPSPWETPGAPPPPPLAGAKPAVATLAGSLLAPRKPAQLAALAPSLGEGQVAAASRALAPRAVGLPARGWRRALVLAEVLAPPLGLRRELPGAVRD